MDRSKHKPKRLLSRVQRLLGRLGVKPPDADREIPDSQLTQGGSESTLAAGGSRVHANLNPHAPTDVALLTEDNSLGIKVLSRPPHAYVDIVFIHGLTGNAHRTWFDKESGMHWPHDLLSHSLTGARIMTFGYDADVARFFGAAALDGIAGYANDLLGCLAGCRADIADVGRLPIASTPASPRFLAGEQVRH